MTCRRCRKQPATSGYRTCAACRAWRRTYNRQWYGYGPSRGVTRIGARAKAHAWLAAGPRTNAQLAELLGISRAYAAVLRSRIKSEQR